MGSERGGVEASRNRGRDGACEGHMGMANKDHFLDVRYYLRSMLASKPLQGLKSKFAPELLSKCHDNLPDS